MTKYLTKPIGIAIAAALVLCIGGVIEKYRVAGLVEASYTKGKADAMAKVLSDTQKLSQTLSADLNEEFARHSEYVMNEIKEERVQRNEIASLMRLLASQSERLAASCSSGVRISGITAERSTAISSPS